MANKVNNTPKFAMPIIVPDSGVNVEEYYENILDDTEFKAYKDNNNDRILKIEFGKDGLNQLYAMVSGQITFIEKGKQLPNSINQVAEGRGAVYLETEPKYLSQLKTKMPPGIPVMTSVVYQNVDPDKFRADIHVAVKNIPLAVLQTRWSLSSVSGNRDELEEQLLNLILKGQAAVHIDAGGKIGQAGLIDETDQESNNVFSLFMTDGAYQIMLPVAFLNCMPANEIFDPEMWKDHPLINAIEDIESLVDLYIKFEIYDETTKSFSSIPPDIIVDLMDHDDIDDDELITKATDANGCVTFNTSLKELAELDPDEDEIDIFFRVHTSQMNHPDPDMPEFWSTLDWKAVDGTPGYFKDFKGAQLGTINNPVVYRIGLDFHIKVLYKIEGINGASYTQPQGSITFANGSTSATISGANSSWNPDVIGRTIRIGNEPFGYTIVNLANTATSTTLTLGQPYQGSSGTVSAYDVWAPAPKGVFVSIYENFLIFRIKSKECQTDEYGAIHGVLYDIEAGDNVFFNLDMKIRDASINLLDAGAILSYTIMDFFESKVDVSAYPDLDKTSIGSVDFPAILSCTEKHRDAVMYAFKCLYELSYFLHKITKGQWSGIQGLTFCYDYFHCIMGDWDDLGGDHIVDFGLASSFSAPGGYVFIKEEQSWDRGTIIHEISHQLMYEESDISLAEMGIRFILGLANFDEDNYIYEHWPRTLTNGFTACVEGWAAFIEAIFTPKVRHANSSGILQYRYYTSGGGGLVIGDCVTNSNIEIKNIITNNYVKLCHADPLGEQCEGALANSLLEVYDRVVIKHHGPGWVYETTNGVFASTPNWLINAPVLGIADDFLNTIWKALQNLKNEPETTQKDVKNFVKYLEAAFLADPILKNKWPIALDVLNRHNIARRMPVVISITPNNGRAVGNDLITITGDHFPEGTKVRFGANVVPQTDLKVINANIIEVLTPSNSPGTLVDVEVASMGGSVIDVNAFTYN
ncbi:MAG: IPT/TIG domain-containing protein [Candidatus Zixiibacteriota bacterium]